MNLGELDRLETAGHTFDRLRLDHYGDFWVCQFAVDGVPRETWLEPAENVAELNGDEFYRYICAQSLGQPPERR